MVGESANNRGHAAVTTARRTPGVGLLDCVGQPNMARLRTYRLGRVRAELRARDYAGIVLYDPINIRYATGSRNMAVWTLHNAARYCFVPTEGPVVLFDFHNCEHLSAGLETIGEVRPARGWYYFSAGPHIAAQAKLWAAEVAALGRAHGGGNRRLAFDHCDFHGVDALRAEGFHVMEGQSLMETARRIKSADEIACMSASVSVCEAGMAAMREALRPGITEQQLWALLHKVNIEQGGEWIETRLLASGGRTNPWFQEASDRIIRAGELVSFDTDLIGPYGMCADISRTYFCGPGRPTPEQRTLYGLAWEQLQQNLSLAGPGVGFRDLASRAFRLPEDCMPNRYSAIFHGVGLSDEHPQGAHYDQFEAGAYDDVMEPGMAFCFESYAGRAGGDEGVKLEQQVLITETGVELLSTFPFEDELLPSRWV